jgi:hypothetical protein
MEFFLGAMLLGGGAAFMRRRQLADEPATSAAVDTAAPIEVHRAVLRRLSGKLGYNIRHEFALDFARYTHCNHGSYGTAPWKVMRAARAAMEQVS